LIPEEFEADPDEAAKKVRKAAGRFIRFKESMREAVSPANNEKLRRLDELLGDCRRLGLEDVAETVIEGVFWDAISEPDP
jgi:hypothetical protein